MKGRAQVMEQVVEERLTPRQREMIRMRYRGQMRQSEIARELGVNKSTVSRTLGRAHRRIRESLYGTVRR